MKTFTRGEIAPSWWANALDGVLRDYRGNVDLRRAAGAPTTTVEVPASAGADGRAALSIDGFWRWNEATVQRAHPGGAAGTYIVWAVTGPQVIVNTPQANTDNTVYTFDLRITTAVTEPTLVPGTLEYWREIGRIVWDGAAITSLSQTGEPFTDTQVARLIEVASIPAIPVRSILEVGQGGHTRAGRKLFPTDFTELGLAAPVGLYSLGDINDSSGNARNLVNKGAVTFAPGITGAAGEAAQFAGSTAQALYRLDTGAADPFRIRTGSYGCWFKTGKRLTQQQIMSKDDATSNAVRGYGFSTNPTTNTVGGNIATDAVGGGISLPGVTDVCDDRYHFIVVTYDGTMGKLYVDSNLESVSALSGLINPTTAPLNIGGRAADVAAVTQSPVFGRVDEAFVTAEVLTEEQIRLLYAVKIPHGAVTTPRRAGLSVRRRRRGALLASADFPAAPIRLHNLNEAGGFGADLGSGAIAMTSAGVGTIDRVAGPDGLTQGALALSGGANLQATDAGLPSGTSTRSFGLWFKTTTTSVGIMGWGTPGTGDTRLIVITSTGQLSGQNVSDTMNGGFVHDGQWHHAVAVEDNVAADGVKRKLYLDGRLVATSLVLSSIVLAGANRFRVGANPDGTAAMTGQVARAFVSGSALTVEQIHALYQKGAQDLGISPKNEGDNVERIDATNIYFVGDDLEPQHQVELEVAS